MNSTVRPQHPRRNMNASESLVHFVRRRDYVFERELGQGVCGQTVLLRDEIIDGLFVCKKYVPFSESHRQELFKNFLREIKLLHEVHHQNVVRVFNYYLYPERLTGYILMEYVDGQDIEECLRRQPESVNELFAQAIEGFAYLESCFVLHRDIRPQNILVREDGTLKIIDLDFGKRVETSKDFDKSISLNWWCEPPEEFAAGDQAARHGKLACIVLHNETHQYIGIKRHRIPPSRSCPRSEDAGRPVPEAALRVLESSASWLAR